MKRQEIVRSIWAVVLVCAAVVSMFGVARIASSPKTYSGTIEILEAKRNTAMGLTAAAAVASVGLSTVPGDATTAVADQIMEMTSCLMLVVCVIFLEKFLLTLLGYVSFTIIIPAACALGAISQFTKNKAKLRMLAVKLGAYGLILSVVIPLGVRVGEVIEQTHKETITELTEISGDLETEKEEVSTEEIVHEEVAAQENDTKAGTWWEKTWGTIKDGTEQVVDTVKDGTEKVVSAVKDVAEAGSERAKELFWQFVEGIAVMLVTTCLIPIFTIVGMVWLTGKIFDIKMPEIKGLPLPKQKKEEEQEISALTE